MQDKAELRQTDDSVTVGQLKILISVGIAMMRSSAILPSCEASAAASFVVLIAALR